MSLPRLVALLIALLPAAADSAAARGTAARDEVSAALERLEAPSAAERLAAQRWLAEHLESGDLARVAVRASSAPPEALRRLQAALGSDERHFELAALLAADSQRDVRALGESALARLAARWLGDQGLRPAPALRVLGALADRGAAQYRLELRAEALPPLLDRLVRLAGADVGRRSAADRIDLVLDPLLAGQRFDPGAGRGPQPTPGIEGDYLTLLFAVASIQGLEVEGFALQGRESARAWLHVTSPSQAGRRSADELLADWARDLLDPRDPERRAAAARALASCGWSAPLEWLERRWNEGGDVAALEGMLLAAGRGRVVPALCTAASVRALLREADSALARGDLAGDQRAELARQALGSLPVRGADGADLAAIVAERLQALPERARFLRLAVIARLGAAPREARRELRAALATDGAGATAVLELEAVRALAATRPLSESEPWTRVQRASAILDLALERGLGDRLVGWMRAAHLAPPPAWLDTSALPARWGSYERLLVAEAWLSVPDQSAAGARGLLALSDAAAVDRRVEVGLRRLASGPLRGPLEDVLLADPTEAGTPPSARERLALLAGLLPPARHAGIVAALAPEGEVEREDALLLGPLAAGPQSERVRELLLGAVGAALQAAPTESPAQEPWARACERAWSDLVSVGRDDEAERLRRELGRLLRGAGHPLGADLVRRRWPRLAWRGPVPLAALESPLPGP